MSASWGELTRIVDGITTFSANDLNPIFDELDNRTKELHEQLNLLGGTSSTTLSCGLAYNDTGFAVGLGKGSIVAFVDGTYVQAKATWSSIHRSDGSCAPSPEAFIAGVLVSDIVDNYATILSYGWSSDTTIITSLLGSSPTAGQYYLTSEGTLVKEPYGLTEFPIYCLTYCVNGDGTGKIIFNPKTPEYSGHSHSQAALPFAGWTNTSSGAFFAANTASYPAVAKLLGATLSNYTLISNGELADNNPVITGSTIFYGAPVYENSDMWLYAIQPMQGRDPLVHTVTVDDNSAFLSADNLNGDVLLRVNATPGSTSMYTGSGIVSFDGNTFSTGPVIQGLMAGPNITLLSGGTMPPGVLYIGNSAYDRNQIDLNITNLDGVLFGTDPERVTYKFPADIESKLYATVRIPHFDGAPELHPVLNLVFAGGDSTASIPELSVHLTAIPMPTVDSQSIASTLDVTTAASSISANHFGLIGTTISNLNITSDMMLTLRITAASPANSLELVAASLQLVG